MFTKKSNGETEAVKTVADAGGDAAEAAASKGSPVLEEVRAILKDEGEKS
jgi:hypothetical protein